MEYKINLSEVVTAFYFKEEIQFGKTLSNERMLQLCFEICNNITSTIDSININFKGINLLSTETKKLVDLLSDTIRGKNFICLKSDNTFMSFERNNNIEMIETTINLKDIIWSLFLDKNCKFSNLEMRMQFSIIDRIEKIHKVFKCASINFGGCIALEPELAKVLRIHFGGNNIHKRMYDNNNISLIVVNDSPKQGTIDNTFQYLYDNGYVVK